MGSCVWCVALHLLYSHFATLDLVMLLPQKVWDWITFREQNLHFIDLQIGSPRSKCYLSLCPGVSGVCFQVIFLLTLQGGLPVTSPASRPPPFHEVLMSSRKALLPCSITPQGITPGLYHPGDEVWISMNLGEYIHAMVTTTFVLFSFRCPSLSPPSTEGHIFKLCFYKKASRMIYFTNHSFHT